MQIETVACPFAILSSSFIVLVAQMACHRHVLPDSHGVSSCKCADQSHGLDRNLLSLLPFPSSISAFDDMQCPGSHDMFHDMFVSRSGLRRVSQDMFHDMF